MEKVNSFTEVKSWTIEELINTFKENPIKKERINIPQYQRNLVWNIQQQKELIDSIKRGLPMGSLLLFHEKVEANYNIYQLVDGLQRVTAIRRYLNKPTQFISCDDLDNGFINSINLYFCIEIEKLKECVKEWLHSLSGFNEKDRFSSADLVYWCEEKLNISLEKFQEHKLIREILPTYLEQIKNNSDILFSEIPIIIYHGDAFNLPLIFERINSKGTQLTRYQIYAATWSVFPHVEINCEGIVEKIKKKYNSLLQEGYEISNYDSNQKIEKVDYFEYCFGFGKLLIEEFPILFGNAKEDGDTETIGFYLLSLCVNNDLRKMEKLPIYLKKIDINLLQDKIIDAVRITYNILSPVLNFKGNMSNLGTSLRAHTELQICSIIGKVFMTKYDKDLKIKDDFSENYKKLVENLPLHYLYDILRKFWSGTGDAKAYSLINDSKYEIKIPRNNWEVVLNEWFEDEIKKREKTRVNIKAISLLFLKYIYIHLFTVYDQYSMKQFEVEHLCSVNLLKNIANNVEGLPISCISNLCLIEKDLNNKKKDKTIYEHFDNLIEKNEINIEEAKIRIAEIEQRTFTKKDELEFMKNFSIENKEDYIKFLKDRFEKLKSKFFDLNNIF